MVAQHCRSVECVLLPVKMTMPSAEHARALAGVRERAAHAEGVAQAQRENLAVVAQERDQLRAEIKAWTAGGPLARAWRVFLNRR